jgi:hypothetical protein
MAFAKTEAEWAVRAVACFKANLRKAGVTYAELAKRLKQGTFKAIFLFACLASLEAEGVRLEDIKRGSA